MAVTIKHRKSSTPSAVPTTTQLALGELAINTFDGKLFLKKNVSGTESVVEVANARTINTGTTTSTTVAQGQAPLTADINYIPAANVTANVNNVVTLPSAVPGKWITVYNQSAQQVSVYPASGDKIANQAINVAYDTSLAADAPIGTHFYCFVAGAWFPETMVEMFRSLRVLDLSVVGGGGVFTTGLIEGAEIWSDAEVSAWWYETGTETAVTAGTNAQGSGAFTNRGVQVITTTAANPSGCTLPVPTQGREVTVINKGTNPVKLYPSTGTKIDGLANNIAIDLPVGAMVTLRAISTTAWVSSQTLGRAKSMIRLDTRAGNGSTNTAISRFTNVVTNVGSDITLTQSATLGDSFTINADGNYAITYCDCFNTAWNMGVTINSSQLTTNIVNITAADRLAISATPGTNFPHSISWTGYLAAGSVIRAHNAAAAVAGATPAAVHFTIARVS